MFLCVWTPAWKKRQTKQNYDDFVLKMLSVFLCALVVFFLLLFFFCFFLPCCHKIKLTLLDNKSHCVESKMFFLITGLCRKLSEVLAQLTKRLFGFDFKVLISCFNDFLEARNVGRERNTKYIYLTSYPRKAGVSFSLIFTSLLRETHISEDLCQRSVFLK